MFAVVFGKYGDACVKDQPKTVSLLEENNQDKLLLQF